MSATITVPEELKTALEVLDPARMLTLTERLCAPAFSGRRVGTEGHDRASAFLVEQFCQVGWTVTTQGFAVPASVLELTSLPTLEQRTPDGEWARLFVHRTELSEHPRSAAAPEGREGLVVALADQARHAGAWIALEAVPQGEELAALVTQIANQGALGLLAPRYATAEGYLVKRLTAAATVALPMLSVRADLLPCLIGTRIRANAPVAARQVSGQNILAQIPGTDARLAHSPLVIGAHYDAVGHARKLLRRWPERGRCQTPYASRCDRSGADGGRHWERLLCCFLQQSGSSSRKLQERKQTRASSSFSSHTFFKHLSSHEECPRSLHLGKDQ